MKLKDIEQCFWTGLIVFLPLIITYQVVELLLHFATGPFEWIVKQLIHTQEIPSLIVSALTLFSVFLIAMLIGIVARFVMGRWCICLADVLIQKIPVVNRVYSSFKRLVDSAFSSQADNRFRQVAIVPYPNCEQKGLGFITNKFSNQCYPQLATEFVLVLIPSAPNPITGMLVAFPLKDITIIDSTPDEALKVIMSCGSLKCTGFHHSYL